MMAFANKIQSQTQLSLKLLIFWVCTSVGHVDGCGYRRKHVDIRIIRNRMAHPNANPVLKVQKTNPAHLRGVQKS